MSEKKRSYDCTISSIEEIAKDIFDVRILCPEIAKEAQPGQFLHIKCNDALTPLLRRPISICDVEGDCVRFVFERKGEGTALIAQKKAGETINVLGPLGQGFEVRNGKCVLIGGGVGIFPLLMLAKKLPQRPTIILGFRSEDRIVLKDDFAEVGDVYIATDDGSAGFHGTVMGVEAINGGDMYYSCGPTPMLKAVKEYAEEIEKPAQISMEQRMGCGIGACLVCTCKVDGHNEKVCQKGPVFWSGEVEF